MPTHSHPEDEKIYECIRAAQTPLEKIVLACQSEAPIPLLHGLADAYLNAVNRRRTKEWEIFWTTTAHNNNSAWREQVLCSLQTVVSTTSNLYELLEHAWWHRILLSKPIFKTVVAQKKTDRFALILWLLNRRALLEAWCQTLLLLPPQFQPRERPLKIWRITSDHSLVSDKIFLRAVKTLLPLVKEAPTLSDEVVVWGGDYYRRGWNIILYLFGEEAKTGYRRNKKKGGNSVLYYLQIPRYGKIILDIDTMLHEEGWEKFLKIYHPSFYKDEIVPK